MHNKYRHVGVLFQCSGEEGQNHNHLYTAHKVRSRYAQRVDKIESSEDPCSMFGIKQFIDGPHQEYNRYTNPDQ